MIEKLRVAITSYYEEYAVLNKESIKKFWRDDLKINLIPATNRYLKDLYQYFKKIKEEFILLTLDDMVCWDYCDQVCLLNTINLLEKDSNIGNISLMPIDCTRIPLRIEYIDNKNYYIIPDRYHYYISLHPSFWRREYLIKLLKSMLDKGYSSAWHFELKCQEVRENFMIHLVMKDGKYVDKDIIQCCYPMYAGGLLKKGVLREDLFKHFVRKSGLR